VVPVTAVRTGPQGDFVWILKPDKTVTKRNVTRGPLDADHDQHHPGPESRRACDHRGAATA